MIPDQIRSVDPFSSYHSDNVNRFTRIVSGGANVIVKPTSLVASIGGSPTLIRITDGIAIKDDVMIHIEEANGNGYSVVDLTDPINYIPSSTSPTPNILDVFAPTAYLVLSYTYAKTSTPPKARLMVLKDIADFDVDTYIFLAKLTFSAPATLSNLEQDDAGNGIYRLETNLTDAYTDTDARNADSLNSILNHLPANNVGGYNRGQVVVTGDDSDTPPGKIKTIPFGEVASARTNTQYTWTGSPILVNHNRGQYPHIQVIDASTGDLVGAIVNYISDNSFSIDFDFSTVVPPVASFNFWVVY